jgi:hypothetical protein
MHNARPMLDMLQKFRLGVALSLTSAEIHVMMSWTWTMDTKIRISSVLDEDLHGKRDFLISFKNNRKSIFAAWNSMVDACSRSSQYKHVHVHKLDPRAVEHALK